MSTATRRISWLPYRSTRTQWSGSGNRGGLVYDFDNPQNYSAVLVSPRTSTLAGSVEVVQLVNGVRHTLASSTDTQLAAGQWGDVNVS